MKLETFFEKFELFADAPDAIEQVRELVLRMATSGRIAKRNPTDTPASELLADIFAIRDKRIRSGAAKNRAGGNPITAGDAVELPTSWARCMISEVCELQTGATPSRQEPSYFGGDIRWLVSGDINKGEIVECDGRITEQGLKNSNCKIIPANSVLIALNGQGKTRATVAVLRVPAASNQSLVAMIPYSSDRLLPEYIFWNLRGRYRAIRDITGNDQRRGLNMKLVGQLSIPIPPVAEQKRIVAKVDELMALCDQLEAQQQERETRHAALAPASLARFAEAPTPANLEFLFHHAYDISPAELRKSILTLAVQGKLVPQNPNEEPASESIAPVVSLGRTATAKYSVAVSDGEAPYQVPVSWSWVRLGSVSELINGDRSKNYPNRNEYVPEGVPWINTGHIEPDGTLSVARMNYIKRKKFDSLRSGKVQRGDLVYCLRGATFGKTAIITQFTEGAVASSLVIIRLSASVLPQFGYNFLISPIGHKQIFQFDNGSAQPNLSARSVKKFWMPLPSFAEQRRIVAKVDELMTLVDKLETQLAAARTAATDLLAAAVAELTNGKENCAAADVSSVAHHRRDRTATFAEYLQPE